MSDIYRSQMKRLDVDHIALLCKYFNCGIGDLFEYEPDEDVSVDPASTLPK